MKRWIKFKTFVKEAWDDEEPWIIALLWTGIVLVALAVLTGLVLLAVAGIWLPIAVVSCIVVVGIIYLMIYAGLDGY